MVDRYVQDYTDHHAQKATHSRYLYDLYKFLVFHLYTKSNHHHKMFVYLLHHALVHVVFLCSQVLQIKSIFFDRQYTVHMFAYGHKPF